MRFARARRLQPIEHGSAAERERHSVARWHAAQECEGPTPLAPARRRAPESRFRDSNVELRAMLLAGMDWGRCTQACRRPPAGVGLGSERRTMYSPWNSC
jgi:hypothetical protein